MITTLWKVPLEDVDRSKLDPPNLHALVIDVIGEVGYKLAVTSGVLKGVFSRHHFKHSPTIFLSQSDINFERVDLAVRTASRLQSFNKDLKPTKCGCKGQCSNKHCKCKRNNFSCNSKCACTRGAFIYDVRCFLGIFDLPTYPHQMFYYISLFSKIRCSLTYLPT